MFHFQILLRLETKSLSEPENIQVLQDANFVAIYGHVTLYAGNLTILFSCFIMIAEKMIASLDWGSCDFSYCVVLQKQILQN